VLKEGKVYVPKNEKLRAEIIQLHHDTPVARHGEKWKTIELVTRNYWWLGVMREIGRYMESCNMCQRIKNRMKIMTRKSKLSKVPEKPWIHLIVDFITKLLIVAGRMQF